MPVVMSQAHPLTRRARVHRHVCIMCASIVPGQQIHSDESQEAFEDSGYFSKISDNSVVLSLTRTHQSVSFVLREFVIIIIQEARKGSGGQKITPKLLNKVLSAQAT